MQFEKDEDDELEFLNDNDMSTGDMGGGAFVAPVDVPGGLPADDAGLGPGFIRQSRHPSAAFFHLFFKSLALLVYMFSGLFGFDFIFVCVICILLLAFDFWTVKNVTGRLLVGLRWWNYVKEDGTNEWVFESLENMSEVNANDSRVFWMGLYVPVAIWTGLLVIDTLKLQFQWLIVVFIALSMHVANIIGYTKCSSDAKAKMKNMMDQGTAGFSAMKMFAGSSAVQSAFSGLFGGNSSSQTQSVVV
eukprot:CAMPEP_0182600772 /NCGR_PEP_ID=MMETSP1324-20130603/91149_1 /TAXON_ID=236786 /ORGANISM="Florenciella sp., Strain RCC1587" /LENGTH=245 /DNA_ID=CAMNT_0024818679 /DNA_START=60 /DNA_END=797 /DNA_ORIENTATION=+